MVTITTIPVQYRDAANYKYSGQVHLIGQLTEQDKQEIVSYLESGEDFIPTNLNLPHVGAAELEDKFGDDDDHVFNTLYVEYAQSEQVEEIDPDLMTVQDFIAALKREHESGWQVSDAMDVLGLEF